MDMIKVTALPTTIKWQGKKYGPFHASKNKAFLEVPADLQAAMGLPLYLPAVQPLGHVQVDEGKPAPDSSQQNTGSQQQETPVDKRTVAELKAALEAAKVEIPDGAKRDDLLKLATDKGV